MGNLRSYFKKFLRINWLFFMKLSVCCGAILIISSSLFAATLTNAQSLQGTKVQLHVNRESLKAALRKLQAQSGFSIFYPSARVNAVKQVNIDAQSRSVAETLALLLGGTGLGYHQDGNRIIISPLKETEAPVTKTDAPVVVREVAQTIRVTGTVRDERNQPMPGVTVRTKERNPVTAITNAEGYFSLEVPDGQNVLVFSFIGYQTREVPVKGSAPLDIRLQPAAGSIDEVQVIGYSTTTRRNNTGSVSSLTSKEIENQPVSNPLAALQGRLPGVQLTQNNGLPGSGFRVQIRGIGSFNSGTLPLYLIDGVPFTLFNGSVPATDGLNAYGVSGANGGEISPLSMINPDDIERIDVLKDADATAIYGSKGANGVVLITTKKGKAGNTKFNVNFYQGAGKIGHFIDMLSTPDYLAMRRAAFAASGVTPTTANAPDLLVWDQNNTTNWQKELVGGTAHTTNADISISGGSAQNTFLFSSNYRREGTVFPGSFGANTFSNRLNAGHKSADQKFGIDLSVNYGYMQNNLISTDLSQLYNLPPNLPLYNADGSLYWNPSFTNPMAYLLRPTSNVTTNLIGNLNAYYQLLPGLRAKVNLGYTATGIKQTLQTPLTSLNPASVNLAAPTNRLQYANNTNNNYIIEPQLEYQREVWGGNIQALVGGTIQRTIADGINLIGTGFSSDALIGNINNAAAIVNNGSNNSDYKYAAIFGRLNYNWGGKYLVDATYRRDGSSRFGINNRFGNFWAVGAGWIFTQESWMKNVSWLSFGKLRGSYGLTGNDQIQNYQYNPYFNTTGSANSYQGQSIVYPSNVPNPDLHWETNKKLDLAVELGFLKDRIYVKADYFRNRSSDQLVNIILPTQAGFNSFTANFPAVLQNQGFEFELNSTNVQTKLFRWSTNINLTILRNEILQINNPAQLFNSSSYIVGQPINAIQLYKFTGINPATGVPTYQDLNGDGAITFGGDRAPAPLGHPYYGGVNNSFSYRGFELNVFFQFNHRMGYLNNSSSIPYGSGMTNQNVTALQRWMKPGDNTQYPGATTAGTTPYFNYNSSDANWGDASFIKLKTVSISYNLPKAWVKTIGFSNLNVFARGENLRTWAKQKYTYDPETTVSGAAPGLGTGQFIAMPQLRTMVLGLNCSF
ncbi:TonB-dependent receptor [Mucilaginibacter sp. CSA2-8R]|uniref:SusC/RagA family TonB-linked outer membrane protein n=1 Tax=Mucilaginibacter sp. CSA2-8R TaxID=3141542 RepID=UPI00315DBB81